jgi:hypothetical protein
MDSVRYQQGRGGCNNNPSGMNHHASGHPNMNFDVSEFPIGMGYVPMQTWGNLYSLEQGLHEGTIFMELNQIFCGKRGNRG